MRRIILVLAAVIFLAALILDTGAVLRIAAIYGGLLLDRYPWTVAAAGAAVGGVLLWPYRPWRRRPARRGKRRPRGAGTPVRPRAAGPTRKPAREAAAPLAETGSPPTPRKPRAPRRPAGAGPPRRAGR